MHTEWDCIVLGGGVGGLTAAKGAAALGQKTLLIEADKIGGDNTHAGSIPNHALTAIGKAVHFLENADQFGLKVRGASLSWNEARKRIEELVAAHEARTNEKELKKLGVRLVRGKAHIIDAHTIGVDDYTFTGRKIVIATGATPRIPDIAGIEQVQYETSASIFTRKTRPNSLIIIGAGQIGCEIGHILARLGTEVIVLERGPQILLRESRDVAQYVQESLEQDGMRFRLSTRVKSVKGGKRVAVELSDGTKIRAEALLVAAGRVARVPEGLDAVGIRTDEEGRIAVNRKQQTRKRNIYACGDCCTAEHYAHYAEHQARNVVANAFVPFATRKREERVVPRVTFTDPEVASVGKNEDTVAGRKQVYKLRFDHNDRTHTEREENGFVKIVTKPWSGKIVGGTIVGTHASELISELALAVKHKLSVKDLSRLMHPYPTRVQTIRDTADKYYTEFIMGKIGKLFGK